MSGWRSGPTRCSPTAWSTRYGRCWTRGLRDGVTASRALGYAQVIADLDDGRRRVGGAREPTFFGTRRYVRRQRSWFRRDHRIGWLDGAATPTTSSARCGYGGTYPEQVMFAKGHGTQNDFVLLPDLDGRLSLTPAAVAALCDRRRGLGADGVLRVTTAHDALAAGVFERLPEGVAAGDWYMDYRNADGSIAQMCGNGVRVFAHYLRASGLESRDEFVVGSLAGPRPVVLHHVGRHHRATSPSKWARPTSSAPVRRSSADGGSPGWPSTSATRIWRASTPT